MQARNISQVALFVAVIFYIGCSLLSGINVMGIIPRAIKKEADSYF